MPRGLLVLSVLAGGVSSNCHVVLRPLLSGPEAGGGGGMGGVLVVFWVLGGGVSSNCHVVLRPLLSGPEAVGVVSMVPGGTTTLAAVTPPTLESKVRVTV